MKIDTKIINYVEIVCKGKYYLPINTEWQYYVSSNKDNTRTVVSLLKTSTNMNQNTIQEIIDKPYQVL